MATGQLQEDGDLDRNEVFKQPSVVGRRKGLRGSLSRFLFGDDVFISYSRRDSSNYALSLANELTTQSFSCYLDQWGTPPGEDLPESLKTALRRSTLLVIVGTELAAASEPVSKEVTEFLKTGRTMIPVSFEGSLEKAQWFPLIRGLAIAQESSGALGSGKPSQTVVSRIVNARGFTRRNARLRRLFLGTAVSVVLLLVGGVIAANAIAQQAEAKVREAESKLTDAVSKMQVAEARARVADQEAGSANQKARDAEDRTIIANGNANKAEARAEAAVEREREASAREKLQKRIASSIQLAVESSRSRGTTAESLLQSSFMSLDSVQQYPTAEGGQELRNNLALMPRRILSRGLPENVRELALSPDGRHVAILVPDHPLEIQLTDSGEVIKKVGIKLLDSGERIKEEQTTDWRLIIEGQSFAMSNDGKFLALIRGAKMRVLEVDQTRHWEVALPRSHRGLNKFLYDFAISPDGKYLATVIGGPFGGNVQVWSVEAEEMVVELDDGGPTGSLSEGIKRVAFSANGNYLAAGGMNACLWAVRSYSSRAPLTSSSFTRVAAPAQGWGSVEGIAPSSDDRFALLNEHTIRIWKQRNRNRLGDFEEAARIPIGGLMAFSLDGERLYVADRKTIQIWETSGPWETMHIPHSEEIVSLAFSPESNQVVTISGDFPRSQYPPHKYKVNRWSIDSRQEKSDVFRFEIKSPELQGFELMENGRYLVLTSYQEPLEIWDLSDHPTVKRIPNPSELLSIASISFSPDGQYIALAGPSHSSHDYNKLTIVIYSMASNGRLASLVVDKPIGFALSVGSKYLVTIDSKHEFLVWDVRTGRKITLKSTVDVQGIKSIRFSNTGRYLALTTRTEISVLESDSWRVVSKIKLRNILERFLFSPDDRYLATVNLFRSAEVWEVAKGTSHASLNHIGRVEDMTFSTDGKYLVTSHVDRVGVRPYLKPFHFLRLSLLQPEDLADELCKRLRMNFSDQEWRRYAEGYSSCRSDQLPASGRLLDAGGEHILQSR